MENFNQGQTPAIDAITYIRMMGIYREKITLAVNSSEFKTRVGVRDKLSLNINHSGGVFDFQKIEYEPGAAVAQYFLNYTGGAHDANTIRNSEFKIMRMVYTELFEFIYILYSGIKPTNSEQVKYHNDSDLLRAVAKYTNPGREYDNARAYKLAQVHKLYTDIIALQTGEKCDFPKHDDEQASNISDELYEYIHSVIKQRADDKKQLRGSKNWVAIPRDLNTSTHDTHEAKNTVALSASSIIDSLLESVGESMREQIGEPDNILNSGQNKKPDSVPITEPTDKQTTNITTATESKTTDNLLNQGQSSENIDNQITKTISTETTQEHAQEYAQEHVQEHIQEIKTHAPRQEPNIKTTINAARDVSEPAPEPNSTAPKIKIEMEKTNDGRKITIWIYE